MRPPESLLPEQHGLLEAAPLFLRQIMRKGEATRLNPISRRARRSLSDPARPGRDFYAPPIDLASCALRLAAVVIRLGLKAAVATALLLRGDDGLWRLHCRDFDYAQLCYPTTFDERLRRRTIALFVASDPRLL